MTGRSFADWKALAAGMKFRDQAFIDTKFVSAKSGREFDSINPATGTVWASVANYDAADVNLAVSAAPI